MDLQAILDASDSSDDEAARMGLRGVPRTPSPQRYQIAATAQSRTSSNHSTPIRGTPRNRRPQVGGLPPQLPAPVPVPVPAPQPHYSHPQENQQQNLEEYANSYAKAMSLSAGAGVVGAGGVDLEQILREDDDDHEDVDTD